MMTTPASTQTPALDTATTALYAAETRPVFPNRDAGGRWPAPTARPDYDAEQEGTWQLLWSRQVPNLQRHAVAAFHEGLAHCGFSADAIPSLPALSERLYEATGWRLVRVEGLVPERPFFEMVRERCFPCTDFIRRREDLDYTPAPDLFHDQFGHVPLLTLPAFARFFERFGVAGCNADDQGAVELARIYWFTVEFGLMREAGERRAFGAGLMSSIGELHHGMSERVDVHPLDFEAVAARPFVTTEIQTDYYEIESFESLEQGFEAFARKRGWL